MSRASIHSGPIESTGFVGPELLILTGPWTLRLMNKRTFYVGWGSKRQTRHPSYLGAGQRKSLARSFEYTFLVLTSFLVLVSPVATDFLGLSFHRCQICIVIIVPICEGIKKLEIVHGPNLFVVTSGVIGSEAKEN